MSCQRNIPVSIWSAGPDTAPSQRFVDLVKDALDNLYDPIYLTGHPLTPLLVSPSIAHDRKGASALRQKILEAMEQLRPADRANRVERLSRTYRILQLRYVEAFSFREVMAKVGLSQTHYHREQKRAIAALSSVLWEGRLSRQAAMSQAGTVVPLFGADPGKPLGLRILQAASDAAPTYE